MRKIILAMFAILILVQSTFGSVLISQVLYDPIKTESGGEAIEFFNPTLSEIDLSGWRVASGRSPRDVVFPDGAIIKANSYFLVADVGWDEGKDNPDWPPADLEHVMTLYNSNSGIVLYDASDSWIDAVGWGDAGELVEGTAHPGVPEGSTLKRKQVAGKYVDTDNNIDDFEEDSAPILRNSGGAPPIINLSDNIVMLSFEIADINDSIKIEAIKLPDEDPTINGTQIIPLPGSQKEINFEVDIKVINSTITNVSFYLDGPEKNVSEVLETSEFVSPDIFRYLGKFTMNYYDKPGNYTLDVVVDTTEGRISSSVVFDYKKVKAIEIDADSLNFGRITPGAKIDVVGDSDSTTKTKPTITNVGNAEINLGIYASDFTSGSSKISIQNLAYSFGTDFSGAYAGIVSTKLQTHNLSLAPSLSIPFSLRLTVPDSATSGNYNGVVNIEVV